MNNTDECIILKLILSTYFVKLWDWFRQDIN
jgi:hypothetical protein